MDNRSYSETNHSLHIQRWHRIVLLLVVSVLLLFLSATAKDSSTMPDRPGMPNRPDMPFRHDGTAEATKAPTTGTNNEANDKSGGWIELHITGEQSAYWTEVEWIDGNGNWNTVTGWRGYSKDGLVRWFVDEASLGIGPFRWGIWSEQNGKMIAMSEQFSLPIASGNVVVVQVQANNPTTATVSKYR